MNYRRSAAGSVDSALSPLQPVIFWMSNAIELLNFCKFDLNKVMRKKVRKERKRLESLLETWEPVADLENFGGGGF